MVDEYSAESRLSVGFSVLWLLQLVRCRDRSKVHSCSSNSQVRYGKIILHYLSPAASFAPRRKERIRHTTKAEVGVVWWK